MKSVDESVFDVSESVQSEHGSMNFRPHSVTLVRSVKPDLKRRLKSSMTPPHTHPIRLNPSGFASLRASSRHDNVIVVYDVVSS
jgi:hypothetical protein